MKKPEWSWGPKIIPNKRKSGFFDLPKADICRHPCHNPPSHMVIPAGKGYRHVCPGCGTTSILLPNQVTL